VGSEIPADAAEDSLSFLHVLKDAKDSHERGKPFIEHSAKGQFAIIDGAGEWKFSNGTKSGGNDLSVDADNQVIKDALGKVGGQPAQLYNLRSDPGERNNLLLGSPPKDITKKKAELVRLLEEIAGEDAFPPKKQKTDNKSESKKKGR
jgi:arylsulfatase A